MSNRTIIVQPLTKEAFAPFGDVIELPGENAFPINKGQCTRHHALSTVEVTGEGAQVGLSLFEGQPYALPHRLDLVERHPLGTQSFQPLGNQPWLVIVCPDENGKPGHPLAFLATAQQGINLHRGTWHGVLTPLYEPATFLVVDRVGEGDNLEEVPLDPPYSVVLP
ncbi:MAG: ureidoglycolate lyase [Pseudomonadota bacterium]